MTENLHVAKPILHIQVPNKMMRSNATLTLNVIKRLKEKVSDGYELVVSPEGSGFNIKSEGTVLNLTIGANETNVEELLNNLDEYAKLLKIATELKEFAKAHPEIILEEHLVPNKNRRSYDLIDPGIDAVQHPGHIYPDEMTLLAPRGTIGPDGNLKIISMDYLSENLNISTKPLKSRHGLAGAESYDGDLPVKKGIWDKVNKKEDDSK